MIFTKYDSTVGYTKLYCYSSNSEQLYCTNNLSEEEAQFNEVIFSETIVKLDSKNYKLNVVKLEQCH